MGLMGCTAMQVIADPVPQVQQYSTQAVIQDMALEGSSGVIGVNIASGDSNAQLNARALAFSVGQELPALQYMRRNGFRCRVTHRILR
ncbi:hypothetical protein [Aliamphritea spongicola]|nr:hypothetical protein [Aliamphritea spongicola]